MHNFNIWELCGYIFGGEPAVRLRIPLLYNI